MLAGAVSNRDEVEWIIREVRRLLSTRSSLPVSEALRDRRRTVVDYGMSDFVHFSPRSRQDSRQLASLIQTTITAYEPRLRVMSVSVETPRSHRDAIFAIVKGHIERPDGSLAQVHFPVRVGKARTPRRGSGVTQ